MLSVFFTVLRAYKALDNLFLRLVIWCLKLRFGSKKTPKNLTAGMSSLVVTLQIGLLSSCRNDLFYLYGLKRSGWSHSCGSVRKLWILDITRQSFQNQNTKTIEHKPGLNIELWILDITRQSFQKQTKD